MERPDPAVHTCRHSSSGSAARPAPGRRPASPRARRLGVIAAALAVAVLALPATGSADPEPSLRELEARSSRLAQQVEVLAEEFNGLRVRLQQARRTAATAAETARRHQHELDASRDKLGVIAATRYMTGGIDPAIALVTSTDPQAVIDQAAVLDNMAGNTGEELARFESIQRAAEESRRVAAQRAAQASDLLRRLTAKRREIQRRLDRSNTALFAKAQERASRTGRWPDVRIPGNDIGTRALRFALSQQGKPYVWGAESPQVGFDCSGLTKWAYAQVGVSLYHYTGEQWKAGRHVERGELRAGDLVFFYSDLHHMGMYVGGGLMVHAPQAGDVVKVESIDSGYLAGVYAGAVRVVG